MTIDFPHLNKEKYYKGKNNEPKCNNPFPWGQSPTKCIVYSHVHMKWSIINKLDPRVGYYNLFVEFEIV